MSETEESEKKLMSSSPKEDYDPLAEYEPYHPDDVQEHDETEQEDSLCNSMDLYSEPADPYHYGITPPVNSRAVKRSKEKSRSHKYSSKNEMREIMHQVRKESPHRPDWITTGPADNFYIGGFVDGMGDDVRQGFGSRKKRQQSNKSYKVTRQQDRDYKHRCGMNSLCDTIPKNSALQVDSPNHFKSLDTNVSNNSFSLPLSLSLDPFSGFSSAAAASSPCSKERLDFIRTFNMLIRMGNKAIKARESRAAQLNRQLSNELQAKYSDIIWLELRAYLNKRKVDEQDDIHYRLQCQVPDILQEVMNFKVKYEKSTSPQNLTALADQKKVTVGTVEEENPEEVGVFALDIYPDSGEMSSEEMASGTFIKRGSKDQSSSVLSLCQNICDTNEDLQTALPQVASLLNKVEQVENLYPTYKAVAMAHLLYGRPEFQHRLYTLYLWINITMELGNKLHYIAKMLNVDTLGVDWPWVKCSPMHFLQMKDPCGLHPTIFVTQPSVDELESDCASDEIESEEFSSEVSSDAEQIFEAHLNADHLKNVRFDVSDSGSSAPQSPVSENPPGDDPSLLLSPADASTPARSDQSNRILLAPSVSQSSSSISFEDSTRTTIYRNYADRMLKRTGVTKLKMRLKNLLEGTLQRAKGALEKLKMQPSYASVPGVERSTSDIQMLSSSPSMDGLSHPMQPLDDPDDMSTSLSAHGVWSSEFRQMALPSFRPMYLFLVRIPLDVIHECLRLRLEQKPKKDPSAYSIGHLIKECKEILEAATNIKIYYLQMVGAVIPEDEIEDLDLEMVQFEDDMEQMLDVYLDYLRLYMSQLQHNNMNPISRQLRDFLEDQWKFAKGVIPYVRGGEANAAKRFCIMATSLLHSISIFLDAGMDDCIHELYDISTAGLDDEMSDTKLENLESESDGDLTDNDSKLSAKRNSRCLEVRQGIFKTCRKFKNLFNEARERTAKALNFAKMLRKDLEIAAEYNIKVPISDLFKKLKETGHYRVLVQQSSGYVILIPGHIVSDRAQMLHLLNVTCGREDLLSTGRDSQQQSKPEGYMLVVKCDTCCKCVASWEGETVNLESSAELTIALSHMEVESLLLVVLHSSQLAVQRKDFESRMVKAVQLSREQISCHTIIAESIQELKKVAMCLRDKVDHAIQQVEEKLGMEDLTEVEDTEVTHKIQTLYRETLLRCYNFGCEYHEELLRLVSMDMRTALYPHLVAQAERWMMFAINKCEKGRGRRPKWAHTGLNFLTVAINLESVALMPEERFMKIKDLINKCIHHVIGDKNANPPATYRTSSQDRNGRRPYSRIQSCPGSSQLTPVRSQSTAAFTKSEPTTPYPNTGYDGSGLKKSTSMTESGFEEVTHDRSTPVTSNEDSSTLQRTDLFRPCMFSHNLEDEFPRLCKMYEAVHMLERERNKKLRSHKFIGRITHKDKEVDLSSLVSIRPVKFRWQRTTKIGEGRFGKVYTAVNTNTGELMAMKEMKFQTNDIQYIKKIIDEIKNLENISGHPSLVQYYGVEVHSDEIYIFMEYCPGGTLADAAKAGLPEEMIRKYTKELLVAVNVLHEHDIVHRDIKGPNVFLTVKGPLKLGDLGCAVQLKNHSTMPSEVKGMEGTAAYMAPEVFTNHEGGRASDIWSLGCTVIEMATGKRPWPELENQFQIMYKVGMGECPAIPANLSEEGQDFIKHCLEHDPKLRWTALKLLEHSFVKIDVSDDENEKT